MKLPLASLIVLGALAPACSKNATPTPPAVPDALKTRANDVVVAKAYAKGVQIYECKEAKWTLAGPEAELTDDKGVRIGRHFAGPTWEWSDGSRVKGELVQRADAPKADAVPWLLLRANGTEGKGALERVTAIQRVDTDGGKAPASGCDATSAPGARASVPYTATYYFYAPSASQG
jgi:hypothetical protein